MLRERMELRSLLRQPPRLSLPQATT
jgi:hypothetical protein